MIPISLRNGAECTKPKIFTVFIRKIPPILRYLFSILWVLSCLAIGGLTYALGGIWLRLFISISFFIITLNLVLDKANPILRKIFAWLVTILSAVSIPLVLNLVGEIPIQGLEPALGLLRSEFTPYFLKGFFWLVFFYLLVLSLSTGWVAAFVTGGVTVLPGIISYFKYTYRFSPVFPWDVYNLPTLLDVSHNVEITFTNEIIFSLIVWAFMVFISVPLRFPIRWLGAKPASRIDEINSLTTETTPTLLESIKTLCFAIIRHSKRVIAVVCCAIILVTYTSHTFFGENAVPLDGWEPSTLYQQQGQLAAFLGDLHYLRINPPSGYTRGTMETINNQIITTEAETTSSKDPISPNIIAIMSESFYDMEYTFPGLYFETELYPNLRRLQNEAVSGNLMVSTYGGGTSTTEFQALTGFNMQFLPNEYSPYLQAVNRPFFSLANHLNNQGYTSIAIHPGRETSWNRAIAYPYMGFDHSYFTSDMIDFNLERGFVSDFSLTDQIILKYEENKKQSKGQPLFTFAVSIQNHAAYNQDNYLPEEWVPFTSVNPLPVSSINGIRDLATGQHHSDLALGELLAYFQQVEEPTIIVFFGDHQTLPDSENNDELYSTVGKRGPEIIHPQDSFNQLEVPFVAWSNYTNVKQNVGVIGVNQLFPTVLDIYNLPQPPFFTYLLQTPTFGNDLVVDRYGGLTYIAAASPEQTQTIDTLEMLQYDYLFGKRYSADFFQ